MTFPLFQKPHDLAHQFWEKLVQPGDLLIDATCGNGHDTFFLASLKPRLLYAFDIQPEALEATRSRIGYDSNVKFVQGCHSQFPEEIAPGSIKLIVYNLGYLPGGNKSVTTETKTTLKSLNQALQLLVPGGLISITCYPGHEEGAREEVALINFAMQLDKETWCVTHQRWLNRNQAPSLLLLQKKI